MTPARVVGRLAPEAAVARMLARFARRLGREEIRMTWVEGRGRPVLELRRYARQAGGAWQPTPVVFSFVPAELGGLAGALAEAQGLALAARRSRRHTKERP